MRTMVGLKRLWFILTVTVAFLAIDGLRAQTTLFSENFEGVFPGAWRVGDWDPAGFPAWWADVQSTGSVQSHSGSWMGYCAGIGPDGRRGPPYLPEMYAFMERDVNLTGQTSPTLTFWINIPSIETGFDACEVWMDNVARIWRRDQPTFGWELVTLDLSAWVGATRRTAQVPESEKVRVESHSGQEQFASKQIQVPPPSMATEPLLFLLGIT